MATVSPVSSYTGSIIFQDFGNRVGLPLDQINFVATQAMGLIYAFIYRKVISYDRFSETTRHLAALIPGVLLCYFCFGYQVSNLLILGTLSYIALLTCRPTIVQRVVLFIAILYLSYLHLLRLVHDYGGYTVDITGPIMIAVQKVTSVAFSYHDGLGRQAEELNPEQQRYAIRKRPSLLEYMSYLFQFQTLMCGPLVYYNDYIEFIKGENFTKHIDTTTKKTPSPIYAVLHKLSISLFFACMFFLLAPKFPITKLADDNFLQGSSIFIIILYLLCTTCVARFKYYHAWNLGETICNAAGLGFNGFTSDNIPNWDLIRCVDIIKYEVSLNLRGALVAWNKTTQGWLRRTAYDRASRYSTLATYVLSAVWHGFYPGYYLTFLTGALYTQAARTVRRCLRPRFQKTEALSRFYDFLTFLTTRIMMAYLVFPFVLLEFWASIRVYFRCFFYGHIACLIGIFILPLVCPPPKLKENGLKTNGLKQS